MPSIAQLKSQMTMRDVEYWQKYYFPKHGLEVNGWKYTWTSASNGDDTDKVLQILSLMGRTPDAALIEKFRRIERGWKDRQ